MASAPDAPRVVTARRDQLELRSFDLESLIGPEHRARQIWQFVERLDLARFYERIVARGSVGGRPATDPKILLCLWLYATAEGVGSGHEVERLCGRDDAYRWICGGVSVNYHTLNDFRFAHEAELDDLLSQLLAVLVHEGIVVLERVAQDGMRVRASAGAASFRRGESLSRCLEEARAHVETLRTEVAADPAAYSARRRAAAERAARERVAAVERALAELPVVAAIKQRNRSKGKQRGKKPSEPRVSTTDPEARVMRMADGGYRPAYNAQLATDVESRVIVGFDLTNRGSDMGEVAPMLDQVGRRTGMHPADYLVDGGFADAASIEAIARCGGRAFAPPMKPARARAAGTAPRHKDSPSVAAWRRRMETEHGKTIYRQRAAVAECVNADLRQWRSLNRFPARGRRRARSHVLMNVLAYDVLRAIELLAVQPTT
jgi:transposase